MNNLLIRKIMIIFLITLLFSLCVSCDNKEKEKKNRAELFYDKIVSLDNMTVSFNDGWYNYSYTEKQGNSKKYMEKSTSVVGNLVFDNNTKARLNEFSLYQNIINWDYENLHENYSLNGESFFNGLSLSNYIYKKNLNNNNLESKKVGQSLLNYVEEYSFSIDLLRDSSIVFPINIVSSDYDNYNDVKEYIDNNNIYRLNEGSSFIPNVEKYNGKLVFELIKTETEMIEGSYIIKNYHYYIAEDFELVSFKYTERVNNYLEPDKVMEKIITIDKIQEQEVEIHQINFDETNYIDNVVLEIKPNNFNELESSIIN